MEGAVEVEQNKNVCERPIDKYISKQFDIDKLLTIPENKREILIKLMTSGNNIFHEEIRTTFQTYGLIIDQREGAINSILNDKD